MQHPTPRHHLALATLAVGLLACTSLIEPAWAKSAKTPEAACSLAKAPPLSEVRLSGASAQDESLKTLYQSFQELVKASNRHQIDELLKFYHPDFMSGDNLTLAQVKNMVLETWKAYPDICYQSKPVEIRVKGDWAAIETADQADATAPADPELLNMAGKMHSESRSILFYRKYGTMWEITSDATVWEEASIRYGLGDNVKMSLSSPEQVKAGESYSATVTADVPDGSFSIATIDNQVISFPHDEVETKFRSLTADSNSLQRVMKANTHNQNEIVTATVGITTIAQQNPDRPSLALNGLATLVKRVNVIPQQLAPSPAATAKTPAEQDESETFELAVPSKPAEKPIQTEP